MSVTDVGYGWVFPKEGKLSVGVVPRQRGRSIRKQTDRYLSRLGLADADVIQVQGHPIRYRRSIREPVATDRALMLGMRPAWPTSSLPRASPMQSTPPTSLPTRC